MGRRPILSNYPHLHNLLRNDPAANKEFNAAISTTLAPLNTNEEAVAELEKCRTQLAKVVEKLQQMEKTTFKTTRFIRLLGEVVEPQVHLRPYMQDVATRTKYEITFSAAQIRMALSFYWDLVGETAEKAIAATLVDDPAEEQD